jgi:integrase
MAALGDIPALDVTTADIEALLTAHAKEGVGARSVNKHRQVVSAIFNFGLRPENAARWRLTANPAAAALKRREAGPARLEVFTVEQIEALARTAETGAWRAPGTEVDADEDRQLGDLLPIAAYTGLRRGELVTLCSTLGRRDPRLHSRDPGRPRASHASRSARRRRATRPR